MAPNGVDDEFFDIPTGLPDNNDVLFFGLFDDAPNEEGVARFLKRGWPHLAASNQRARLLLAGKGMSESLARQVDGHERVVRLGFVPDLPDLLRRCRVVLVPVWHGGGTRLKVLEALASARPIRRQTGKAVEGIGAQSGQHTVLAEEPVELADAVARLLEDAAMSAELASSGRELAERFRWDRVLAGAESVYRAWITGESASPLNLGQLGQL